MKLSTEVQEAVELIQSHPWVSDEERFRVVFVGYVHDIPEDKSSEWWERNSEAVAHLGDFKLKAGDEFPNMIFLFEYWSSASMERVQSS
jgi:hypothetical protein